MLVLTRKKGEEIKIGDDVTVTVVRTGKVIKLGIEAPTGVRIIRAELIEEDVRAELPEKVQIQ